MLKLVLIWEEQLFKPISESSDHPEEIKTLADKEESLWSWKIEPNYSHLESPIGRFEPSHLILEHPEIAQKLIEEEESPQNR